MLKNPLEILKLIKLWKLSVSGSNADDFQSLISFSIFKGLFHNVARWGVSTV